MFTRAPKHPPTARERWRVDVEENSDSAGFGTTRNMKWRWIVRDRENDDRVVKADYQFTARLAQKMADQYVDKLVSGRKRAR
ncbi:hypothetical protein SCMC78_04530 [Streptomyces sp. CMC78]|uniref:Uncharacterized protein n=1 Tax=Streptomyces sp. CMC78 TaxID=3231512 RepID=A0AB33K599_9ACTN